MTTPSALPPALSLPGRFSLVSDTRLASDVQAATPYPAGTVIPVAECHGRWHGPVYPLQLLHALGRATSALPALSAFGAGGLAGLSALRLTSAWGILRYLWAFDPPRGTRLTFSPMTQQVRGHHRSVFSEQMAVAIATIIVEDRVFQSNSAPRIVDADAVWFDPFFGRRLAPLAKHRPDYFFMTQAPNVPTEIVVVEVKGNSSGRAVMVRQLARAVDQVLTVPPIPGFPMRRIAVGTVATAATLTCYAIEVVAPPTTGLKEAWRGIVHRRSADRKEQVTWEPDDLSIPTAVTVEEVPDELSPDVAVLLDEGDDARLLTFAGRETGPIDLRRRPQSQAAGLLRREVDGEVFAGREVITTGSGAELRVFTGLRETVLAAAERGATGRAKTDVSRAAFERFDEKSQRDGSLREFADVTGSPGRSLESGDGCLVTVSSRESN